LTEKSDLDVRELKQLMDEQLVSELYEQIKEHQNGHKLACVQLEQRNDETRRCDIMLDRLTNSHTTSGLSLKHLPPASFQALCDICDAEAMLGATSSEPALLMKAFDDWDKKNWQTNQKFYDCRFRVLELKDVLLKLLSDVNNNICQKIDRCELGEKALKIKKIQQQANFTDKKCLEYEKRVSEGRKQLNTVGLSKEIKHERLVEEAEAIAAKQSEVEEFKATVKSCHWLPTNIDLAKVKVEEKRREYQALCEQVDKLFLPETY